MTHDPPHVVLRCNASFTNVSGLQLNDIIGLPLKEIPVVGAQTEPTLLEEFLTSVRSCGKSGPAHSVLTLYHSFMTGGTLKFQTSDLYSVHAFPVFKRGTVGSSSSSSSISIPISRPAEEGGDEAAGGALASTADSMAVGLSMSPPEATSPIDYSAEQPTGRAPLSSSLPSLPISRALK